MDAPTETFAQTPATINRKTKYYYNHRNDPVFMQKLRDAKRKYYLKNREAIIAKVSSRYYKLKEAAMTQEQIAP